MIINNYTQLQQVTESGGHLRLDNEGQLRTQGAFRHAMQKIADFFRSLTPGGAAVIQARNAQLRRAMDDIVRQHCMINPARGTVPRQNVQPRADAPSPSLAAPAMRNTRFMQEVGKMAEAELSRLCPKLSQEEQKAYAVRVTERMRSLLVDANVSDNVSQNEMHRIVYDVAKDIVMQRSSEQTEKSGAKSAQSGNVELSEDERIYKESYETAKELVDKKFPAKSDDERKVLAQYVCGEIRECMVLLKDEITQNRSALRQRVTDMVDGLTGTEKPERGPVETEQSAKLSRKHELTAKGIRPDTLLTQGQNTCFMVSVLNSMMTSKKGRRILEAGLGSDGRMTIGGEKFQSDGETNPTFSALEHSLGSAYKVHGSAFDPDWSEGSLGEAVIVAQMFGLKVESEYRVGDWHPDNIREFLDAGKMVLLYSGKHYTAVVGMADDGRLIVRNSLPPGTEEYIDINKVLESRLQVFSYPEE